MPTAQRNQPTRLSDRGLGLASRLPGAAIGPLGRVGSEAENMWKEARALSRRGMSTEQIHADVVSR